MAGHSVLRCHANERFGGLLSPTISTMPTAIRYYGIPQPRHLQHNWRLREGHHGWLRHSQLYYASDRGSLRTYVIASVLQKEVTRFGFQSAA